MRRRQFIKSGSAIGAASIAAACASNALLASTPQPTGKWDDSWTGRLGKHRTVFDVSEYNASPGAYQVAPVMDSYHEVLGVSDRDLGFVLVIRHFAVGMTFSDSIWQRYDVGAEYPQQDAQTKAPVKNPFRKLISDLSTRGVVILACHSAAQGLGAMLAKKAGADAQAVRDEIFSSLLPGVIMQPNGLYALARAQDVGCGFMR